MPSVIPEGIRIRAGILLLPIMVAGLLWAGLRPLNFHPVNRAAYLAPGSGLRFGVPGSVYSEPFSIGQSCFNPESPHTLEMVLRMGHLEPARFSSAFALASERTGDIFTIGEWQRHLLVRMYRDGRLLREVGGKSLFRENEPLFLSIVSLPDALLLYVNGNLFRRFPRCRLENAGPAENVRMILGNTSAGRETFTGDILWMAAYDQALSPLHIRNHAQGWSTASVPKGPVKPIILYAFQPASGSMIPNLASPDYPLLMPATFRVIKKSVLVPPWKDFKASRSYLKDVTLNILGFIPFGFYLGWLLRRLARMAPAQATCVAIACGLSLSLCIEITQVFLPARSSQLADVLTNTMGTALGALLAARLRLGKKSMTPLETALA